MTTEQRRRELETFAHNLRILRVARDYSLEELAAFVGVNSGTVSRWESAISKPYSRHERQLAEVLDVKIEDLWKRPLELKVR